MGSAEDFWIVVRLQCNCRPIRSLVSCLQLWPSTSLRYKQNYVPSGFYTLRMQSRFLPLPLPRSLFRGCTSSASMKGSHVLNTAREIRADEALRFLDYPRIDSGSTATACSQNLPQGLQKAGAKLARFGCRGSLCTWAYIYDWSRGPLQKFVFAVPTLPPCPFQATRASPVEYLGQVSQG